MFGPIQYSLLGFKYFIFILMFLSSYIQINSKNIWTSKTSVLFTSSLMFLLVEILSFFPQWLWVFKCVLNCLSDMIPNCKGYIGLFFLHCISKLVLKLSKNDDDDNYNLHLLLSRRPIWEFGELGRRRLMKSGGIWQLHEFN